MNNVASFLKKCISVFVLIGVICFFVKKYTFGIDSIADYLDIIEPAITITVIILLFYGSFFWRYNPLEKIPRIMGEYTGTISYSYMNKPGNKDIEVSIKQNLFGVKVKIKTNEITSNTVTGNFVEENDDFVLYYNYITNPKSEYSEKNPIQRGTCRLVPIDSVKKFGVEWVGELNGTYWTSRQTIGDIKLKKVKQKTYKN